MKRLLLAATAAVSIVGGQQAHAGDLPQCGSDLMHKEVTELWNENVERWQPRIVDIYDDAVSTAPGKPNAGKVMVNCIARAQMSRGDDLSIHYTLNELRGKWFVYVVPADTTFSY